ncbi:MAG: endo-1,4-beta-xylanase [Anaerolineales bacterium]|nr:endo-1,4-beta-xylanase [Anaerolineales bacterium]
MMLLGVGMIFLMACQATPPVAPSPTLSPPSVPTLTPTLTATPDPRYPWLFGRGGHLLANSLTDKCLYRRGIRSIYPKESGGLRDVNPGGLWLGTSVGAYALLGVHDYSRAAAREYNLLATENALKFAIVHPYPERYNFCEMDTIMAFARVNQMAVRGVPLVWEQQLPEWVFELSMPQEAWQLLLQDHITQLVTRYAGRMDEWDVINEPLTEEGTFKETIWYQNVGPEYIELALRWAHAANPQAKLFINEFATENLNPKSDALYALAQDLLARGVPLHGIGFQMHLLEFNPPDPAQVAENFRRFNALGLEVAITEMDVRIWKPATPEKLEHEAEIYRNMLEACLAANCDTFIVWGVSDANTWIQYFYPDYEMPLLLDEDYQPKAAYWALWDVLQP